MTPTTVTNLRTAIKQRRPTAIVATWGRGGVFGGGPGNWDITITLDSRSGPGWGKRPIWVGQGITREAAIVDAWTKFTQDNTVPNERVPRV